VLQALVKSAAENLERFDTRHNHEASQTGEVLIALTCLTLEEIASEEAETRLQQAVTKTRPVL
jgi:hypothetical protein